MKTDSSAMYLYHGDHGGIVSIIAYSFMGMIF